MQEDCANHQEYCRQRYHHQQIVERERRREEEGDKISPQVLVDMLQWAIALPIGVERMAAQLKQQYGYLGVLKYKIFDALTDISDVPMAQHQEMIAWAERLSN